jgi:Na+/H+-dicarboxylate symporter
MQGKKLTIFILVALAIGLAVGYGINQGLEKPQIDSYVGAMGLITTMFLRLIKMIIAPLVLATLVMGIAKLGDLNAVGRIGGKALAWFIFASIISLSLGLVMVNVLRPGDALHGVIELPTGTAASAGIATGSLTMAEFVTHLVPMSIADAMAKNEILQIVLFSIFFGIGLAAMGEKGKPLVDLFDTVAHVMLKVTGYVMMFAPIAVFAAVSSVIAKSGIEVVKQFATFMLEFYISIAMLWGILLLLGFLVLGKRIIELINHMRDPLLLAFSTASSEAAYPKTLEGLEKFGVSTRIGTFVLPLGYSFNLDGSMMYCTFAGGHRGDAGAIQYSGGRFAVVARRRPFLGYGPFGDQRGG